MHVSRRRWLAGGVSTAAGLAGCIALDRPALVVENAFDRPVSFGIDVTRLSDSRVVFDATRSVAADGTERVLDPTEGTGRFRISVVAEDVNAGGSRVWRVQEDEPNLRARLRSGGVDFSTGGDAG